MNRDYELHTVEVMIDLSCRLQHGCEQRCPSCEELRSYAAKRLACCRFGDTKPACKDCPIHCYSPRMRERIAAVMRFAGPRMLLRHPVMAIRHLAQR